MKKVLAVLLMCGVLVSSLAACGSKSDSASNNEVVSSNETVSETNQETEQPKETSFLPPAEHSNYIAPKAEVGQKYNIKQMDFIKDKDGAFRKVGYFDENHMVVGGNAVYDFDGNLLFDEQKIIDSYPEKLPYASIRVGFDNRAEAIGDYVIIETDCDNCHALLYNYKNNSFFNFDSEGIEPLDLYENYMVVSKHDAEKVLLYSVIDYNNKTIIPFSANYSIMYIGKDFILANKNQKNYILDMSGNIIKELKNTYKEYRLLHGLQLENIEKYIFTDLKNQMTDYIIGEIGHKKENEEFISSYSYYLIDKKGNEIYLTDQVAAIEDSCRMVSQYNGKSYLIEYLDDFFEDNGNKIQKKQLIDENRNIIIKPCFELSGYINGYCRVGEFDEQSNTIKYSLIDLDGNAIETYSYTINSNINGQVKDFSIVDEQGLYVLTTYNGDSTVYTIKDTAGNTVYTSGTKLVMLGNGIFGMNGTIGSGYEYLIKITKA